MISLYYKLFYFQEEILQFVGEEAFSLGLLMGTEGEEDQLFCFHHLLLQEFVAGKFVATLNEVTFHFKSCKINLSMDTTVPTLLG